MYARLTSALVATLVAWFPAALFAQAPPVERPWTLMIYGAADNDADGPILGFLERVRSALDDDPGMELVLFLDRSEGHSTDTELLGADFTGARVYRLRKASAEWLDASDYFEGMDAAGEYEVDSADPRTLGRFVAFCKARFPAQRYGLMIYSHADGYAMCPDDESGRAMGIPELTDWVGEEASVDLLALELCNMGGIEIAYQWRPGNGGFSAEVLVAIPNAGAPLDWDRAMARIRSPGHDTSADGEVLDPASMTAADFGRLVIEEGYAGRRAMFARMLRESPEAVLEAVTSAPHLLREAAACYDLTVAARVKEAIDALTVRLAEAEAKESFQALRGFGDTVDMMNYARRGQFHSRPYVDLYELLDTAAASPTLDEEVRAAAGRARDAVDEMVLDSFGMEEGYERFRSGRNGIFIVFPDGEARVPTPTGPARVWTRLDWYTPLEGADEEAPYGRWDFLIQGATPGNGEVENWFELLDAWFDDPAAGPEGTNRYAW